MTKIDIRNAEGRVLYHLVIDTKEPAWAYNTLVSNADSKDIRWRDTNREVVIDQAILELRGLVPDLVYGLLRLHIEAMTEDQQIELRADIDELANDIGEQIQNLIADRVK